MKIFYGVEIVRTPCASQKPINLQISFAPLSIGITY